MKKHVFAAVCISAFLFTLSACSVSESESVRLSDSFTVTAHISDCGFETDLEMKRTPEAWFITVLAPETIAGMEITLSEYNCLIEYEGLSYSVNGLDDVQTDGLPEYSPIRLTAAALDKCVRTTPSGYIGNEEYSFDFEDGIPQTLSIGKDFSAEFSDFSL